RHRNGRGRLAMQDRGRGPVARQAGKRQRRYSQARNESHHRCFLLSMRKVCRVPIQSEAADSHETSLARGVPPRFPGGWYFASLPHLSSRQFRPQPATKMRFLNFWTGQSGNALETRAKKGRNLAICRISGLKVE